MHQSGTGSEYVRISKESKAKPLSVLLAPVGKSVSFGEFEFFYGAL